MEANKILTADFLDILFEGRNKEYGAYELRRTYRKRLLIACCRMLGLFVLMFGGYLLAANFASSDNEQGRSGSGSAAGRHQTGAERRTTSTSSTNSHLRHQKWKWPSSLLLRS